MSHVRLTWKVENAHQLDFDLSDPADREYLVRVLDHHDERWGGETPTEEQIKARMEEDEVGEWESGYRMPQYVVDFLENASTEGTWFDSDPGQIEIRDFEVYEKEAEPDA